MNAAVTRIAGPNEKVFLLFTFAVAGTRDLGGLDENSIYKSLPIPGHDTMKDTYGQ